MKNSNYDKKSMQNIYISEFINFPDKDCLGVSFQCFTISTLIKK